MAKKAYIGVDGVARKIKKGYIGVDGKARKIKKAYIGIGSVARPCWSGGELAYYGKIANLWIDRAYLAATTVGDYAIFGGGYGNGASSSGMYADAYNKSLTKPYTNWNTIQFGGNGFDMSPAATTIGNYALFGGGYYCYDDPYYMAMVNAVDSSLTVNRSVTSLRVPRSELAAASTKTYAWFGGGGNGGALKYVDAYNSSLTRNLPAHLISERRKLAATTVGNHVLFGGGEKNYSNHTAVEAYNDSLTKVTVPSIFTYARSQLAATAIGKYALFGGGVTSTSVMEVYDEALTRTNSISLSESKFALAATTVGDFALFAGGSISGAASATADAFDPSLTRTTTTNLNTARQSLAATSVGNCALFGGGNNPYNAKYYSVVDAYVVA